MCSSSQLDETEARIHPRFNVEQLDRSLNASVRDIEPDTVTVVQRIPVLMLLT